METGEVNEVSGDLEQLDGGLDFSDFHTDLFPLGDSQPGGPTSPNDVVPSPSEALSQPAVLGQHVGSQTSNRINFSNLLTHAMRDTAASSFVLPWETDEWSCIFDPDRDIMDALLPSFEPKLKAVKLIHVEDDQPATCETVVPSCSFS